MGHLGKATCTEHPISAQTSQEDIECAKAEEYSHLSNSRGGGAKVPELINEEVGINVEGGIFWKKTVHNYNK